MIGRLLRGHSMASDVSIEWPLNFNGMATVGHLLERHGLASDWPLIGRSFAIALPSVGHCMVMN
eukprot:6752073-Lingulodinium_polyedra.AAC.1